MIDDGENWMDMLISRNRLTLIGNRLNLAVLNKISLELDDLLLPYTFDLDLYHHIKQPDLIDHIQRSGKVFYSKRNWCP